MFSWHCVSRSYSRSWRWNVKSCRLQVKNYEATFQHTKMVNLPWGADRRDAPHLAQRVSCSDVLAALTGIILKYQRGKVFLQKKKTLLSDNQEIWSRFFPLIPFCVFMLFTPIFCHRWRFKITFLKIQGSYSRDFTAQNCNNIQYRKFQSRSFITVTPELVCQSTSIKHPSLNLFHVPFPRRTELAVRQAEKLPGKAPLYSLPPPPHNGNKQPSTASWLPGSKAQALPLGAPILGRPNCHIAEFILPAFLFKLLIYFTKQEKDFHVCFAA